MNDQRPLVILLTGMKTILDRETPDFSDVTVSLYGPHPKWGMYLLTTQEMKNIRADFRGTDEQIRKKAETTSIEHWLPAWKVKALVRELLLAGATVIDYSADSGGGGPAELTRSNVQPKHLDILDPLGNDLRQLIRESQTRRNPAASYSSLAEGLAELQEITSKLLRREVKPPPMHAHIPISNEEYK